jgi:hypothetical protein
MTSYSKDKQIMQACVQGSNIINYGLFAVIYGDQLSCENKLQITG